MKRLSSRSVLTAAILLEAFVCCLVRCLCCDSNDRRTGTDEATGSVSGPEPAVDMAAVDGFEKIRELARKKDPHFLESARSALACDSHGLVQASEIAVNSGCSGEAKELLTDVLAGRNGGFNDFFHAMRLAARLGDRALFDRAYECKGLLASALDNSGAASVLSLTAPNGFTWAMNLHLGLDAAGAIEKLAFDTFRYDRTSGTIDFSLEIGARKLSADEIGLFDVRRLLYGETPENLTGFIELTPGETSVEADASGPRFFRAVLAE